MNDDLLERLRASRTTRWHDLDGAELDPESQKWICVECGVAVTYSDEKPDCPGFGGYLEWEAADEIERLRALITAWADAEDALGRARSDDATVALRKAVRR